ncbi:MAG: gamma-glutamyltransferase family protein [Deltaproteobacteria bacterium]|nr:gamma-glutamyltransferase family protein [Deltaproteobacteria bacterium]
MFTTHRLDPVRGAHRSMVIGRGGMACTSQPLASFAAAEILRRGGGAIDAAVAAAAMLGVVEPFMTGLGGDCMILYWHAADQRLYGLNGSGRAPAAATPAAMRERGHTSMPLTGALSVTVPGAVDAWCAALARFGRGTLAEALAPAIDYAESGFPVSEIIAGQWAFAAGLLQNADGQRAFTLDGRAPRVGEIMRLPELAHSLRLLAAGGRAVVYGGELGAAMVACVRESGGLLALDDLTAHTSTWVEPIAVDYRGVTVCELPPNPQGLTALLALNILESFGLDGAPDQAAHLRIEAVKLAFADRNRYLADPDRAAVPVAALLSKDYAQGRAALIHPDKALKRVAAGTLPATDTVYLTTADAAGNVCSLINSLYLAFGSGLVAGRTGIALQNRGAGFSLDATHPNCLAPGKRPFHTIIPAMLLRDGRPLVSFGVMGGDMQAQGHVQVVSHLVDDGDNLQEAIERPRFNFFEGDRVALERELAAGLGAALARRGHVIEDETAALLRGGFGGAQGIAIDPTSGAFWGASDPRKDGCAVGF